MIECNANNGGVIYDGWKEDFRKEMIENDWRKYAANSKRDKRRFQNAYANPEDAHNEVAKYEQYMSQPDTL